MLKKKLLVVEDEQRLADILQKQLGEAGFLVEVAYDGFVGRKMTEHTDYDLILLDINLPVINGYELCRELRKANRNVPIIMLTAFGTTENKLTGFDTGADDYVLKPYDFRELLARINVFLKRSDTIIMHQNRLTIANLEMDLDRKTIVRGGQKIQLTSKEFALLELLLKNKGKLLARDYIIEKIWGIDFDTGTNVLDVYINYLRKKIDMGFEPKLIYTKFGFGFYCNDKEL